MGGGGGFFSDVGKAASSVVKSITKGVGDILGEVTDVVKAVTPWNDDTTLGKAATLASLAAGGYFAYSALAGTGATAAASGATTAGLSAEGAAAVGTGATATGSIGAATSGAMGAGLPGVAAATVPSVGAETSAAGTGSGLFSSIGSFVTKHPLATGMIASGALQGVGSYLQAKEMAKLKEQEIEESRRQFDALHNMGLDKGAKAVESPTQRVRRKMAEQELGRPLTPQELSIIYNSIPAKSYDTRAGRYAGGLTGITSKIADYYNSSNIGLFRV